MDNKTRWRHDVDKRSLFQRSALASSAGSRTVRRSSPRSESPFAADLKPVSIATIATTGVGRDFEALGAQGFWRTFAEIDFGNDEQIADFCRRYGDPIGALSPRSPVHNAGWFIPWEVLSDFARSWSPAGPDGISRVIEREPTAHANEVVGRWHEKYYGTTRPRFDPKYGMQIEFEWLAGFMVASAVAQLEARTPLRRCDVCAHWHSFARSTSKTCSAACRNTLSRRCREQATSVQETTDARAIPQPGRHQSQTPPTLREVRAFADIE